MDSRWTATILLPPFARLVSALVVHVGHARVLVAQGIMAMRMRVRLAGRIIRPMLVLVMRVMHMRMRVLDRLMLVLVLLGLVQPLADAHEQTGSGQLQRQRLGEEHDARLLSRPQAMQAPTTAMGPSKVDKVGWPDQESRIAPATRHAMPTAMRRLKFSWKMNQAIGAVATPSSVRRRGAVAASVRARPATKDNVAIHSLRLSCGCDGGQAEYSQDD